MLQQTQVPRVVPKFSEFIERFPDASALAAAPLSDVLAAWSGLGYNRRAKFLWQAAGAIVARGGFPDTIEDLVTLPGIGPNTAGAILVYAFNKPALFIETNIRSVILHHFFAKRDDTVRDSEIATILEQMTPARSPRTWHWALMDYGTHLKATHGGQLHKVHGYKKQSAFQGSRRQIRGRVLKLLLEGKHSTEELEALIADTRLPDVLTALKNESLIATDQNGDWHLTA
jgi:A/G-specific adenine glycosylase